ncbi:MAG: camphor resistance protein CrcB [Bacteroidetes bacterium]|nr:camphor resistance protein CrcB [Bacteroidota bacterium]
MKELLLVGFGGFIGSIARFLFSRLNLSWHFLSVPMGTLTVNVLGSLIIGFLVGLSMRSTLITNDIRLFLMVGFCGGFTTFSSFTSENLTLLQSGQVGIVLLYTGASIVLGFLSVYLGYVLSNII